MFLKLVLLDEMVCEADCLSHGSKFIDPRTH